MSVGLKTNVVTVERKKSICTVVSGLNSYTLRYLPVVKKKQNKKLFSCLCFLPFTFL